MSATPPVGSPTSPAPAPQGTTGAPQVPGAGEQSGFVKAEEFKALAERIQAQSNVIGKQTNQIKALEEKLAAKDATAPTGTPTGQPDDAVGKRMREMEQQLASMKTQAKQLSLREALSAAGVGGSDIDDARIVFEARHGASLVADETGNVVRVGDNPLGQYVQVWLQGDGKRFLPSKTNPSTSGVPGNPSMPSNVPTVTREQLRAGKVDYKAVSEGRVRVVD